MSKEPRDWKSDVDAIRRILMSEWDPIGCGVPDDEYDSYIGTIYRMMQERASIDVLAAQLNMLVTGPMCLKVQPRKDRRVAELLLDLMN
jgi:hypothetical protein